MSIFRRNKQQTFVYCPVCGLELVKNGRFLQDTGEGDEYMCARCNCRSLWWFDDPVPWPIKWQHLEARMTDNDLVKLNFKPPVQPSNPSKGKS